MKELFGAFDGALRIQRRHFIERRTAIESTALFRVDSGAVGVFYETQVRPVLIEIIKPEEYGGEILYGNELRMVSLDCETSVMSWGLRDVPEDESLEGFYRIQANALIARLALALAEQLYQRTIDAYLWLARRVGEPAEASWVVLPRYVTHELVSQVVGTAREHVTENTTLLCRSGAIRKTKGPSGRREVLVNPGRLLELVCGRKAAA